MEWSGHLISVHFMAAISIALKFAFGTIDYGILAERYK